MSRSQIMQDIIDTAENDYYTLSEEERTAYCLKSIYDAVSAPGLKSYYERFCGAYAAEAPDLLYSIGLDDVAAILESANAIFPDCIPPEDFDERNDIIFDWDDEYDALFEEWTNEILEGLFQISGELERILDELDE